jgi:hypothetical protein
VSDPQPTTMLDALSSDHRAISAMLDDPAAVTDTEEGSALREEVVMNLVRHYVAEEQYLNPVIREYITGGQTIADAGYARDRASETALRRLEHHGISHDELVTLWAAVRTGFSDHVTDQETLFGQLAESCPSDRLAELGDEILGAEQLAPTRPRSVATENAAASKVLSIVEGYVDQVRDHYSRRGVAERDPND